MGGGDWDGRRDGGEPELSFQLLGCCCGHTGTGARVRMAGLLHGLLRGYTVRPRAVHGCCVNKCCLRPGLCNPSHESLRLLRRWTMAASPLRRKWQPAFARNQHPLALPPARPPSLGGTAASLLTQKFFFVLADLMFPPR